MDALEEPVPDKQSAAPTEQAAPPDAGPSKETGDRSMARGQLIGSAALALIAVAGFVALFLNRGLAPSIQLAILAPSALAGAAAILMFEWPRRTPAGRWGLGLGSAAGLVGLLVAVTQLPPAVSTEVSSSSGASSSSASSTRTTTPTPSAQVALESSNQITRDSPVSAVFQGDFPGNVQDKLDSGLNLNEVENVAKANDGLLFTLGEGGSSSSYRLTVRALGAKNILVTRIRAHVISEGEPEDGSLLFVPPQAEGSPAGLGFDLDSPDLDARNLSQQGALLREHYLDDHYITLAPDELVSFNLSSVTSKKAYEWDVQMDTSDGNTYFFDNMGKPFRATGLAKRYESVYAWGVLEQSDDLAPCEWPSGCGWG